MFVNSLYNKDVNSHLNSHWLFSAARLLPHKQPIIELWKGMDTITDARFYPFQCIPHMCSKTFIIAVL